MRRFVPFLVALGLVAAVVVPYLALGGGSFEPTPVADPCEPRDQAEAVGVGETIERIALRTVDSVACKLGVSREDLVLALRSEDAFTAFSTKHGIDRTETERAIHEGLLSAIDEAEQDGTLPGLDRAARAQGGGVGLAVAPARDARAPRELPSRLAEVREPGEPGCAVARLAPDHWEERLVERQVTVAAIARVRQIHIRLVETRLDRDEVRDERHARDGAADVRRRAVPREAVMEGSATRIHDDGDEIKVGAIWCRRARPGEPVVRRMELRAGGRRLRPRV